MRHLPTCIAAGVLLLAFASCYYTVGDTADERRVSYQCGSVAVSALFGPETVQLSGDKGMMTLTRTPSASGAKYVKKDSNETEHTDTETLFWEKGETALLQIDGQAYPDCVAVRASR